MRLTEFLDLLSGPAQSGVPGSGFLGCRDPSRSVSMQTRAVRNQDDAGGGQRASGRGAAADSGRWNLFRWIIISRQRTTLSVRRPLYAPRSTCELDFAIAICHCHSCTQMPMGQRRIRWEAETVLQRHPYEIAGHSGQRRKRLAERLAESPALACLPARELPELDQRPGERDDERQAASSVLGCGVARAQSGLTDKTRGSQ